MKFTSHYFTEYVKVRGSELIMMYSSVGISERIDTRRGLFFLKTVGFPPETFHGYWADVQSGNNSGSITFMRRTKQTDAILENIGYPLDIPISKQLLASD